MNVQGCFSVLDNYDEGNFKDEVDEDSVVDDVFEVEDLEYFFDLIHANLSNRKYELVFQDISSLPSSLPINLKSELQCQTNSFVLHLLKESSKQKIPYHIILHSLNYAEKVMPPESDFLLTKTDIGKLKMLEFVKLYVSSFEIFKCGCIQKAIMRMYFEERKLSKLLDNLIKQPNDTLILKKYQYLSPKVNTIECFEFYCELFNELLRVFSSSNSHIRTTINHLLALCCDFPTGRFIDSCGFIGRFSDCGDLIMPVSYNRLFKKVAEHLDSSRYFQVDFKNISNISDLITKNDFERNDPTFRPLRLINSLMKQVFGKDPKIELYYRNFVASILAKIDISSERCRINIIYLLSLAIHSPEPQSVFSKLFEYLKDAFNHGLKEQKEFIISIFNIIENIARTDPRISICAISKSRVLLDSDASNIINLNMILENFEEFTEQEIFEFCEKHLILIEGKSERSLPKIFSKLTENSFIVKSDILFKVAYKRAMQHDKLACQFLLKKIELMIEKKDIMEGIRRIIEGLGTINENLSNFDAYPFFLDFIQLVLLNSKDQNLFQPTSLNQFIMVLLILYCNNFDKEEVRIREIFGVLMQKIEVIIEKSGRLIGTRLDVKEDDPAKIFRRILEICKSFRNQNIISLKSIIGTPGHLLIKILKGILMKDKRINVQYRIVEIFSILFEECVIEIRQIGGETGSSPYCQLATSIDGFIKHNANRNDSMLWWFGERLMKAFVKCTEEWNILFVVARVESVLMAAKENEEVQRSFAEILRVNEFLALRMARCREYEKIKHLF